MKTIRTFFNLGLIIVLGVTFYLVGYHSESAMESGEVITNSEGWKIVGNSVGIGLLIVSVLTLVLLFGGLKLIKWVIRKLLP